MKAVLYENETQAAADANEVINNLIRFAISQKETVGSHAVLEGVLNGWVHLELASGYTVTEVADILHAIADELSEPAIAAAFEAVHQRGRN